MKKVLFDQIFTVMKEMGIKPMLGTKTNIKRLPNVKHFGNFEVDGKNMEVMINSDGGPERVLKMFQNESGFIPQMNDQEGRMFLKNLIKLRPLINPPENVIPGPGSLERTLQSKEFKDKMTESKAIWKEMGADSTTDQGARKYLDYGDEMKEQGLDSDSLEDVIKFMKGKRATTKIIEDEQGVGSLFKEKTDTQVVDVVEDLDTIVKDAGNLQSEVEKLKDLAFKLTPEYEAQQKAAHQAWMKRAYEGKGFDGREGYFRAVTRPFLIDQHKKGIINIPEKHLDSISKSMDLSSGGGMEDTYPDPVRMFRHYYGEEAFDRIPENIDSPATSSILEAFATDINSFKPIKTTGMETGMGYQTKGELLARIEERQKLINDIRRGDEYPITQWSKDEKLKTIASTRLQIDTYKKFLDKYYPGSSTSTKSTKLWDLVDDTTGKRKNPWDDFDPDTGGMAQGGRVGLRKGSWPDMGGLLELETEVPDYDMEEVLRLLRQDQYGNQRTLATGGRVGLVKGSGKKGIESLIKTLNEKLGKDTIKKASDLPKGTKYEELEAIKTFEERNPAGIGSLMTEAEAKIAGPIQGKSKGEFDDFSSVLIDEKFFRPDAVDFMGKKVPSNWLALEKTQAQDTLQKLGPLPSTRHPNYKDMKRLRQGVKNRINALEITEELGGNVAMFDYLRMQPQYLTGNQVLDPSKFIKKGETPPVFGFGDIDFNTPEVKTMMEKAGQKGMALSDAMKRMGYDSSSGRSTIAFDEAVAAGMEGWPREIKEQVIRAKYGDIVDQRLLDNMLADDNHFRLAEVFATIDQGLKMQEQGMGGEQIVEAIKSDLKRKPNAAGGGVGSMFREV
jgi:hypothetical protein